MEHFKRIEGAVAPFEETVIYHFKESIISKLLISKGSSFIIFKGLSAGHNSPTVKGGVHLLMFLADSILTRGIMPC